LLPNYLGTAWYCNSEQIVAAVDQADLILALGEDFTHFTIRIFGENEYEIKKPIIQVYEYKEELDRTFKSKVAIHMPVSEFVAEAKLDKKQWLKEELQNVQKKKIGSNDEYSTLWCVQNLSRVLPSNAVFFGDVGNAGYASITELTLSEDQKYFTTGKFGVCGWSIPTSMGHAYGEEERATFTITGDLSMNMNGAEVANVKKFGVKSNFIVFNNGKPQNVSIDQGLELGSEVQSELPEINWGHYAVAYGLGHVQIQAINDLENLSALDFNDQNYLIEIVVDATDNPLRE
jgi:thiamine pyrophosphate-dependent acetolactate synthase large subunit-like protein